MTTTQKVRRRIGVSTELAFRSTEIELRAKGDDGAALPAGICGRVSGIALIYDSVDEYGTVFARGCLARTVAERVATRKVKLFEDHEMYVGEHVGTVVSVTDVGDSALMVADLFDTPAGRTMKEYLTAVLASRSDTGLSIGFRPVKKEFVRVAGPDGIELNALRFTEIELKHIGVTPVPAVEGADVTSVRSEAGESDSEGGEGAPLLTRTLEAILRSLPEREARAVFDTVWPGAAKPDTQAAPPVLPVDGTANAGETAESAATAGSGVLASDAERVDAVRRSYAAVTRS